MDSELVDAFREVFSRLSPVTKILICSVDKSLQRGVFFRGELLDALERPEFLELYGPVRDGKILTTNLLRSSKFRSALGFPPANADVKFELIQEKQGRAMWQLIDKLFGDPRIRDWLEDDS